MNALLVKDEALRIEALNQYEVLNSLRLILSLTT